MGTTKDEACPCPICAWKAMNQQLAMIMFRFVLKHPLTNLMWEIDRWHYRRFHLKRSI